MDQFFSLVTHWKLLHLLRSSLSSGHSSTITVSVALKKVFSWKFPLLEFSERSLAALDISISIMASFSLMLVCTVGMGMEGIAQIRL